MRESPNLNSQILPLYWIRLWSFVFTPLPLHWSIDSLASLKILNLVKFDLWPNHTHGGVSYSFRSNRLQWMTCRWKGKQVGFPIIWHLIHRIKQVSRYSKTMLRNLPYVCSLAALLWFMQLLFQSLESCFLRLASFVESLLLLFHHV